MSSTTGPGLSADSLRIDDRLIARLADALVDDLTDRIVPRVERRLLDDIALRSSGLTPGAF